MTVERAEAKLKRRDRIAALRMRGVRIDVSEECRMDEIEQIEQVDQPLLHAIAMESLRFPGEDDGRSLVEMAERDLEATLQLLAERALHVTGAAGAAIALRDGERMICRASSGASAPKVGIAVEINSGLSGESVRTRQMLHCEDTATDARVDAETCRAMGIGSAMVLPLIREEQVFGLFELLSARPHSFEERDLAALQRLGEMIQTAVEHAEAGRRAQVVIGFGSENTQFKSAAEPAWTAQPVETVPQPPLNRQSAAAMSVATTSVATTNDAVAPAPRAEHTRIGRCTACGFPISEGRALCMDCDNSQNSDTNSQTAAPPAFSGLDALSESRTDSGLRSYVYVIGAVLVTLATLVLAFWSRR